MTYAMIQPLQSQYQPAIPRQADNDNQVIAMWLKCHSKRTQTEYSRDVLSFIQFVNKPLSAITLGDLQDYQDSLQSLAPRTQARRLASVKSLLSFGQRIGYLQYNAGAAVKLPKSKHCLAEKILSEEEIHLILAVKTNKRDRVLLRLFYSSGIRVSELCGLIWKDLQKIGETAILTVYGKGSKTRMVTISENTFNELQAIKGDSKPDEPIFKSRKQSGHLTAVQVWRIVRQAARTAGIDKPVSPHWLRHSHSTHSLLRGCPIHVLQNSLGHESLSTTQGYLHLLKGDGSSLYLGV